jgi:hypothetical protein
MSLDRFINSDDIILSTSPLYGETFENLGNYRFVTSSLTSADVLVPTLSNIGGIAGPRQSFLELHIYDSDNNLLKSSYFRNFLTVSGSQTGTATNPIFGFSPEKDLRELGYDSGIYTMVYNPIYNFAGSFSGDNADDLKISEISSDRTEIRIKNPNNFNLKLIKDIQESKYAFPPLNNFTNRSGKPEFLLNFGNNIISDISYINFVGEGVTPIPFPTGSYNGQRTLFKPPKYPLSPRGFLFKEIISSSAQTINDVTSTRRFTFFTLELNENNEPEWVQEKATEGTYAGAPYYLFDNDIIANELNARNDDVGLVMGVSGSIRPEDTSNPTDDLEITVPQRALPTAAWNYYENFEISHARQGFISNQYKDRTKLSKDDNGNPTIVFYVSGSIYVSGSLNRNISRLVTTVKFSELLPKPADGPNGVYEVLGPNTNPEDVRNPQLFTGSNGQLVNFANVRLKNQKGGSLLIGILDGSGRQGISDLYIKLTSPLDDSIDVGQSLSIDGRLQKSYIEKIVAYNQLNQIKRVQILQPNFNIDLDKYGKSDGTDFKAWNDLLDANLSTSQQIINSYFSGSFGNIELNIDYSDFKNFVHYSSATERVDNFFSKLQTIEGYNSRIVTLQQISGSHALTNISQSITRRDTLIGGFDGFEKWMYNKGTGSLYTHYSTTDNPATPYPKISTYPIVFYPTTSSQAESWYEGVYSSASLYDSQNDSALINMIPFALREDRLNEDYVLFINMIGHHFDILWTYVKSLEDINKREEHPEDGMSDDLLYDVAKSMGWYLSNGWGNANLWEYTLGTNSSGSRSQTIGGFETKSKKKIASEVWRRILNNLPYIYKSKGTSRSIKALLSCYGIPSLFLKIREYGGPTIVESPNKYEAERFIYKVETTDSKPIRNPFGTINGSVPNTIEVIGKMPLNDFTIGRLTGGGTDLNFEWNYSGGQARILAKTGSTLVMSSSYMNYRVPKDGAFGIISGSSTTIRAAFKDDFGNILASLSATSSAPNSIFGNSTQFIVGDGIGDYSSSASIQEIRYYSSSLSEEIFQEHALNTEAYFSDDNTTDADNSQTSYKNLVYRIFPDSGFNTISTSISSSHPNQFFKTTLGGAPLTASLPNHTSADLVGEVDTQFVKVPSAGTLNENNNKVRIESSVLSGSLNVERTGEVSQYDYTQLDSNLVGLYFSSTDVVNDDIYNSEGYFEIDDWVGDPDDRFNDDYPLLKWRASEYFKKYANLTPASGSAQRRGTAIGLLLNLLSLYDHSIFQQVKQLIPARCEYIGGVLLEPHILERNKIKRGDKWSLTRLDYPLLLEDSPKVIEASKLDYLGIITPNIHAIGAKLDYLVTIKPNIQTIGAKLDYLGTIKPNIQAIGAKLDYSAPIYVKDSYYKGALIKYEYPILSGSSGVFFNVQNPWWERQIIWSYMDQRLSPIGKQREFFYLSPLSASLGKYYSSSLIPYSSVQTDELPLGLANLKFNGCNSGVTSIDGLPSVEIFRVDSNALGIPPRNSSVRGANIQTITSLPTIKQNTSTNFGGSGAASSGRLFV